MKKKDCFGRDILKAKVCNVDKNEIVAFWKDSPFSHMLKFGKNGENHVCMTCGIPEDKGDGKYLDRAHIYPDVDGGSKRINNLHLLCRKCHTESEPLEGYVYWLWIYLCSKLYKEGSMLEYDYDGGKTYHDDLKSIAKYESQAKIRYWYDRITFCDGNNKGRPSIMLQPQAWTLINGSKILANTYFDIGEFKNIEFISEVDECMQLAKTNHEYRKKVSVAGIDLLHKINFENYNIWEEE